MFEITLQSKKYKENPQPLRSDWGIDVIIENLRLSRIIRLENLHALFQKIVLVILDEGCADTQTLLLAATSDQTDGRYTIVHQFVSQLTRGHTRITDREDLLELLGALTVYTDLLAEVVLTFVGGFQHGSQRILGTMART